ncbi:hypothetical protein BGX27_000913 [Mortierella sp. AM989]|nr:hypothetical protein BGX27_000913 [Mortierella sp. AM989]
MNTNDSSPLQENTVAILFIGNSGAGKSTLLSQLGGNFESGVKFRAGYTTDIYETRAMVNGEEVVLMDVPGFFEPDDEKTKYNASKLTEALKRGYRYMLYFVLEATNRGPPEKEMVMMSKVNECVRQAGSKATYRMIINQIQSKKVYEMYDKSMALDNCECFFKSMQMKEFSFDITITGVLMLMYDEKAIEGYQLRSKLEEDIQKHQPALVSLKKDIEVSNKDVKLFTMALMGLYVGGAVGAAVSLSAVGGIVVGSIGLAGGHHSMGSKDSSDPPKRKTAVVFIGNAGAGKSTLLSQIGGNFKSGDKFRSGLTTKVSERKVKLGDEDVVLIDIPGLFEPNLRNVPINAEKIASALNRRYNYKLFFVLRAKNSGIDDAEVEMMVKLSECVRQKDGSKVPFGVFINQIQSQRVFDMYHEKVIKDNFSEFFNSLKGTRPTTDVEIDCVIPFWFDEDGIENNSLEEIITKGINSHKATELCSKIKIVFEVDDEEMHESRKQKTVEQMKKAIRYLRK